MAMVKLVHVQQVQVSLVQQDGILMVRSHKSSTTILRILVIRLQFPDQGNLNTRFLSSSISSSLVIVVIATSMGKRQALQQCGKQLI